MRKRNETSHKEKEEKIIHNQEPTITKVKENRKERKKK